MATNDLNALPRAYRIVGWLGNAMAICLDGHDDSILGFMSRLAAIVLSLLGLAIGLGVRGEVIVVEDARLGRSIALVSLVAEEVIAALVNGVEGIFRIRHGAVLGEWNVQRKMPKFVCS